VPLAFHLGREADHSPPSSPPLRLAEKFSNNDISKIERNNRNTEAAKF